MGCLTSNIPSTVKASQEFEIICGQISLEFSTNSGNTYFCQKFMEVFEHRNKYIFSICLPHIGLAKERVFNHQYHFLLHLNKQHIIVLIWPQICIYCAAAIRDEFSKLCAVCVVVWKPGVNLCGGWFVIFGSYSLQGSIKFSFSNTKECNCRNGQNIMGPWHL